MKDTEIIALYWSRNEAAIAATADAYANYCHCIAYNILGNNEDAEECVNDTFLRAWNSIPPHRPGNLASYLGKITRNQALNRYKARNTQKRGGGQTELALEELKACIPAKIGIEETMEEKALTAAIENFLSALPKKERNIFIGRYWYLYPIRDISIAYGISQSNVASLLYRMRNKLKLHLEKEGIQL